MLKFKQHQVSVIVPGLQEPEFSHQLLNRTSILKFFTRGSRIDSEIVTAEQGVLEALGHKSIKPHAIPTAVCTAVADTGEEHTQVTRADPVHIHAEPDHARLHAAGVLQLTTDEENALLDSLNTHFADRGLEFFKGQQSRWYLTGMDGSQLRTEPLSQVSDRNVVAFMKADQQPLVWRQMLTEVQMLLHEHPVNNQRMEDGLLPVNSLWCWGGHPVAEPLLPTATRVYADDAFCRGLARLSAFKTFPPAEAALRLGQSSQIVCIRALENNLLAQSGSDNPFEDNAPWQTATANNSADDAASAIQQEIDGLEQFMRIAQRKLLLGHIKHIDLIACNAIVYRLRRRDMIRFWSMPWSAARRNTRRDNLQANRDEKTGMPA